eukprot:scaffold7702_cov31-Prasinocladus_malaysianus.AAC.1
MCRNSYILSPKSAIEWILGLRPSLEAERLKSKTVTMKESLDWTELQARDSLEAVKEGLAAETECAGMVEALEAELMDLLQEVGTPMPGATASSAQQVTYISL